MVVVVVYFSCFIIVFCYVFIALLVTNLPSSTTVAARFSWTPLTTVEVARFETLTLECAADGWPVPTVTWERHGGQLPAGRYRQVLGITYVYIIDN